MTTTLNRPVDVEATPGVLYDALVEPAVGEALLAAVARRGRFRGLAGELVATPTSASPARADQPVAPSR